MNKLFIIAVAALFIASFTAAGQTRAETSLYDKTMRKPAVKAAGKFLKKYPESVYAPRVIRMRDSLLFYALKEDDAAGVLAFRDSYPDSPFREMAEERIKMHNTSLIGPEDALRIAGASSIGASGWRKDNVEHILSLDKSFTLSILNPDGKKETAFYLPVYTLSDNSPAPRIVLPMEIISPLGGRNYLHFGYINGDSEYVEVLYQPENDVLHQAIFYGKSIPTKEGEAYRIEGDSPEFMEGVERSAEVVWLSGRLLENPSLIKLPKADILTDESIRWWLERNPRAATSATKLVFGQLDPESSIAEAFRKARKEKGRSRNAALFDIRGYTVICTASKAGGDYVLVWCEPICRNKNRDRFLNSIYFEGDGTTLDLFYYKGSSTFKLRISLPSQTLRR